MSMGFDFLQSSPSDQGIDLDIGDLKLQYNAALEELNFVSVSFESYMDACNRVFALFDAVEANEGMLDPVVRDFVNRNGELSMALGIDLAMEDDSQDAQKQNGEKVTEKKQGFFRRIWEAIKAFITRVIHAIGNFFHWIGNIFNPVEKKVDAIEKNTQQIIEAISKSSGDINKSVAKEDIEYDTNSNTDPHGANTSRELVLETPEKTIKLIESFIYVLDQFANSHVEMGLDPAHIQDNVTAANNNKKYFENQDNSSWSNSEWVDDFNELTRDRFNKIASECNQLAQDAKNLVHAEVKETKLSNAIVISSLEITAPAKIRLVCPSNLKSNEAQAFFINNGWVDTQWLKSGIRNLYNKLDEGKKSVLSAKSTMERLEKNLSELEKKVQNAPMSEIQQLCKIVSTVYRSTAQSGMKLLATYGKFITAFDDYLNNLISLAKAKGINVLERNPQQSNNDDVDVEVVNG